MSIIKRVINYTLAFIFPEPLQRAHFPLPPHEKHFLLLLSFSLRYPYPEQEEHIPVPWHPLQVTSRKYCCLSSETHAKNRKTINRIIIFLIIYLIPGKTL